ncbi:MAG: DUF4410 domain-containing protein [Chthoniobacterales bacterium]
MIRYFSLHSFPRIFFLLIAALLIQGCASVSIKNTTYGDASPKHLPERIYVRKFVAPKLSFHVNRKGKAFNALVEKERLSLASDLLIRLTKHIAPAFPLGDSQEPPVGNYWLITGKFNIVDEGNLLLRACIGFGLGKTTMETQVKITDLSEKSASPFLTIGTTGGSGIAPGAATAFIPITGVFILSNSLLNAGGSVGGALGTGISSDSRRTAREIVAALSYYAAQHGMINPTRALHPKRLGEIPEFL